MGSKDGRIGDATKILDNGSSIQRWDLVVVAEGYQESELPKFAADTQSFVNLLFATAPFDQLKRAINVHRLDVISQESGADDPKTCTGGTGATPKTFFDATFCARGIDRLLTVDSGAVIAAVTSKVPLWNSIVVIVNSSKFGGSGGPVAVFSVSGFETGLHEMGHTAFGLADEYACLTCRSDEKDRNHQTPPAPGAENVTIEKDRAKVPWRDLILDGTPIPTTSNPDCLKVDPQTTSPVGASTVGAFEGANKFHCGVYRAEFDCKMRNLGQPFCAVCQRKIRWNLTHYIFGTPETFGSTWGTGWTSIVPLTLQGSPHFLSYKNPPADLPPGTKGKVELDLLRPDASDVDTIFEDHWSAGWTSMMPFTLGGQPHLLSYKEGSGSVAIDRIRPDGTGVDSLFGSTWGTGWTSFVPFELGGQPNFLSYKLATGKVEIGRIRPDGSEVDVDTTFEDTWSTGWTLFAPLQLRGKPHFLSYKGAEGRVDIDRLRPDGSGSDTVFSEKWWKGWTTLTPFTLAGDQFVLAYNVTSGDVSIFYIFPAGDGFTVQETFRDTWTLGWTTIVPFVFQGEPHYLAYKLDTGSISIGRY